MLYDVLLLAAALLGLWAALRWFERVNLYFPDRTITFTPGSFGLHFEEAEIRTKDGLKLHGWLVPPKEAKAWIVVCHGNAGNISNRVDRAVAYLPLGIGTLLFDYRGYGKSQGRPTEEGMYLDAEAAYDWLRSRGVPAGRIVPLGESLGGSVALELALRREVGAVVLEGSPTSTVEVGEEIFPFLPVRWIARYRYDALERIPRLKVPILVAHSEEDDIIRFRHGERLFEAAPEPKTFVRLRGGHNEAFFESSGLLMKELSEFLKKHLKG